MTAPFVISTNWWDTCLEWITNWRYPELRGYFTLKSLLHSGLKQVMRWRLFYFYHGELLFDEMSIFLHLSWRVTFWWDDDFSTFIITRIILRPLSALSLDEGLNSPCDKNRSAALWKREPISDDYLPSMPKAVLSISGNVYNKQEMEIDKLNNDV